MNIPRGFHTVPDVVRLGPWRMAFMVCVLRAPSKYGESVLGNGQHLPESAVLV